MGDNIPENGAPVPLIPMSIVNKALGPLTDEVKINICKLNDPDSQDYGYWQAVIRRGDDALVIRTKIPKKEDYNAAFGVTLMSIAKEIEEGLKK
jgi:hypothetical protein